ncbi:glycosyltransferase [Actinokineospora sp.]|uniref:glycosyltransferase n=1 Tax=Actinokineospora sp. TaxID=1872133 RepID=UPI003D6AF1BA
MSTYEFDYSDSSPYGAAIRLIKGTDPAGKVVIDLGCGAAAVANAVRELGGTYIGLDKDSDAIAALTERGFGGHIVDLADPDLVEVIETVLDGRRLAAILALDVLEHLADPITALDRLGVVSAANPDMELVASIPNIGHIDVARQVLAGRWEMSESGLLDRTHMRFFTDRSLTEMMASTGWYESAREDFCLPKSDLHIADHPLFEPETNAGAWLAGVRGDTDPYGDVNQFVRRFHRGGRRRTHAAENTASPFLSIVMRTQGRRTKALQDVLCCLAAQTELDFEILLVVHGSAKSDAIRSLVDEFEGNLAQRVRVLACDGGTRSRPANVGLRAAAGDYIVFLDDDDLVTADWVENIRRGATEHPGMVIRWWGAEQQRRWTPESHLGEHAAIGPLTPAYTTEFDFVRHIRQNETPFHCFSFPRSLLHLGVTFDETLTVCEDWAFLLRAASLCGVHDTRTTTSIYNKWSELSSSHSVVASEWETMRALIQVNLDSRPILFPPGSVRRVDRVQERVELAERRAAELEGELAEVRHHLGNYQQVAANAHHALAELRASTSWKVSAPIRMLGAAARKVLRR